MAGDYSGFGVCRQGDDPIPGFPQDGAGLPTTQDALQRNGKADDTQK